MLLIWTQLKTICRLMTSVNARVVLLCFLSSTSQVFAFSLTDIWPFSSDEATTQKIQQRMDSKELSASTRYYARGPYFLTGQKWDEANFLSQLEKQNFRIREEAQSLLAGDAKKMDLTSCKALLPQDQIQIGTEQKLTCWAWQNHRNENFLVLISDSQVVLATLKGLPWQVYWHAALDSILVAQFRGQEPIMQSEQRISEMPVNCLNAVLAIEDNDFLDHSGVSYTGMSRAFIKNIIKLRAAQGGSTITQQLVKNYFLTPEKTLRRKLKEFYLAIKLESEWSKDEILETYLNIIYMGQAGAFQVHGFGAASRVYFNKDLQSLNLPECALLAAIINNPQQNNPWKKPEKALARRNLVLTKMRDLNLVSSAEFTQAQTQTLPPQSPSQAQETAPYFFDAVRKQMTQLGIIAEGAQIITSLDLQAQTQAQKFLLAHIADLESNRKHLRTNKEKGSRLEGLVLSSENATGLVNVVVGGQNYRQTQFNRALEGHRQIGSLIKPVVYLTALIHGFPGDFNLTPLTQIPDEKLEWRYDRNKIWSPENYERKYNGPVPLYFALKESLNAATAAVAQRVGLAQVIKTAQSLGFTSAMDENPATSLGATQHFPIEILKSYQTLAGFGFSSQTSFIEKIEDRDGKTVFEFVPKKEPQLDPVKTQVLVGMMQETLKSGTAKSAKSLGWDQPSAGKTGTTSDNKDAWFAGFTPHQSAVVWLGYDRSLSSQLTGGSGAVPVWVGLMKSYSKVWPADDFPWSEAVEKRKVPLFHSDKETELIFQK